MIPLLPFAAGMVAGGLLVRLMRDEKTQAGVRKAQQSVRSATDSGLAMIKTSSASVKRVLWPQGDAAGTPPAEAEATPTPPKKKAAPRRKKPAAAAPASSSGAGAKTSPRKPAPRKRATKAEAPATGGQDTQA